MITTITKSRRNASSPNNPDILTNLRDDISEVLQEIDSSIQLVATETEDADYIILCLDTDGDAGIYLKLLVSDKLYIQYSNAEDPDGDWATIAQYAKGSTANTYAYISASITTSGDIILYGTYLKVNSSDNSVTTSVTTPILALTSAISATDGDVSKMLIVWASKNTMSSDTGDKYANIIPLDEGSKNGYSPWLLVSKDVRATAMYNLIWFQLESDVSRTASTANTPYFKRAMWSTTGYKGLTVLSPLYTPGSVYVSTTTRLIEYTDAKYDGYCIFNDTNYYVVNGVAFLDNSVSSDTYTEDETEEEEEDMEDITIEDIEEPIEDIEEP